MSQWDSCKKKKQSLNSSFSLFLNRFLYSRCHEDDSPQHWSWSGPLASFFFFLTGITQGLSSYLNPNPRTPITLNGSIATSLYTHAQIYTKEQREWKTERESERVSIHTVDSATWSKATGREGETRALKMVLQLILWVLAVTLSKYTLAHTHMRARRFHI